MQRYSVVLLINAKVNQHSILSERFSMKTLKVKITFQEEVLGTASPSKEIHAEYIASKAPDKLTREEEVEAIGIEEVVEKAMTIFPRDKDSNPIFWDYQWKGFFKDTCAALMRCEGFETYKASKSESGKGKKGELRAYKKVIDGCIFVHPRMIAIKVKGKMGNCQRPLRGNTAQGERIALANSETVPAGSTCELEIQCLSDSHEKFVREWLDYGQLRGIGQWRNSGKGRFTVNYLK